MAKKKLTKKQKRKIINRIILAVVSAITIYVLFFNNALWFLTEIGIEKTETIKAIIGFVGLIFCFGWVGVKSQKGEI